jgi:hypothetical protein
MASLKDTRWDFPGTVNITDDLRLKDAEMRVREVTHTFRNNATKMRIEVQLKEGAYPHRRSFKIDTTDDPNISKSDVISAVEAEFPDAVQRTG